MILLLILLIAISSTAQVSTLSNWTDLYDGTGSPGNLSYTVPAGNGKNRLLVVAISSSTTGTATRTVSISYGGQNLTEINSDLNVSRRAHTALYCLNESELDLASNNTLSISISGGTTRRNTVFAAVFENVNQYNLYGDTQNYNNVNTVSSCSFSTSLSLYPGDLAVKVLGSDRTSGTARTISNFGTNWTAIQNLATNPVRNAVGNRAIPTSNTSDNAQVTMSGASYLSMTGASISPVRYYRSRQSGNWNTATTWQYSLDSTTWVNASLTPNIGDSSIVIQSGHNVTLTANETANKLIVHGTLSTSTYTLDFLSKGTLTVSSTGYVYLGGTNNFANVAGVDLQDGSTANYSLSGNQDIYNDISYSNLILSNGGTKSMVGDFTVRGTLTADRPLTTNNYKITSQGDIVINNTFTPGTGKVELTGGSNQTISSSATIGFYNLTVNKSAGNVTLSKAISVSNALSLQSGIVNTTNTNLLSITNTSASAIVGGSNSSYINGPLERSLPANLTGSSTYLFPIGVGASYYPFTLNTPTTGTGSISAKAEAFTSNSGGTIDGTLLSKSTTEYWQLTTSGNFTNSKISVERPTNITPLNSIAGSTSKTGTYTSLFGSTQSKGVNESNLIGSNRFFAFAQTDAVIFTSVASVSGYSYPVGYGPSNIQSFTVSGNYLSTNVTLLPTTHYEISTIGGNGFTPTNPVILNIVNNTLNPTNVYVRLKAGFAIGTYQDTIRATSTGATTKEVKQIGQVVTLPVLNVSVSSLSGFTYIFGQGPSLYQSFNVSGSNLLDTVRVKAPSAYEISTAYNSGYTSLLKLIPAGGTLSSTTIYVRLKAGIGIGSFNQTVTAASLYAVTKTVSCSGSVTAGPVTYNSRSILPCFIYTQGAGPSGSQSLTISGTDLTANIVVTAPSNFQVSKDNSTWSSSVTYTQSGGTVAPSTLYIRMNAGLGIGTYGPVAATMTSTGATTKSIAVSGRVVSSSSPTMMVSDNTLSGFGYHQAGGGPSPKRYIVVSGSALTNNITITPPTNYEISLTANSGYQSSAMTLTRSSGRVNPTLIYIRLKSGLSAASYNETLPVTSSGATTINVSLVGKVYVSPLISTTGSGKYCEGDNINLTSAGDDILNRYWEGPNNYYSSAQNPTLSNATTSMTGDYSVTGNVVIGGNLIYNGDFEEGNIGFGSGYEYKSPAKNALWPEATYTVVANPKDVHDNFSTCSDHTPSPGTKQMVINGSSVAGVVIWSQSVAVTPGADYEFSYWVQSVVAEAPSKLQLYVNGVAAGPIYTANLATCDIKQFIYNTSAGSKSILNLELINQNTAASGNDFAIDDIEFKQILWASDIVSVTVNSTYPVSVSISASANPILENSPVTYTAVPTNPGSSPTYQWYVNNVPVGPNSSTFTSSSIHNGDVVKCVLTSSLTCTTGNPATSNTVSMVVIPNTNYWIGTTDTDWGKTSNWTGGFIPAAGDNVEFATVANNSGSPAVNNLILDTDRTIGSYINTTNFKLIIPVEKSLIVNGSISTSGNNRLLVKAENNKTNGTLIFPNETNPVYGTVEMWSKGYVDVVCECPNDRYYWQFFGPPVHSFTLSNYDDNFYLSAIRRYDETKLTTKEGQQWTPLADGSVLEKFKGYEITNKPDPKKLIFEGRLVNDNLSTGELSATSGSYYKGWHLLSNPYTAAISVKDITFGSGMEQTVYLYTTGSFNNWRNNAGDHGKVSIWNDSDPVAAGQYLAIPKNISGFSASTAVIPSMQGFMVGLSDRVSPPPSGKTVSYNYSSSVKNTQKQRIKSNQSEEKPYIYTTITIAGAGDDKVDRVWLFTDDECTEKYDNGWDGRKILSSDENALQAYATQSSEQLQIHATNDINGTRIGIRPAKDQEIYTLYVKHQNTDLKYEHIYLYDNVTNNSIDITDDKSTYSFIATENSLQKRFKIITVPVEDPDNGLRKFNINVDQYGVFILNNSDKEGIVRLYNTSGNLITTQSTKPNLVTGIYVQSRGIYILQIESGDVNIKEKIIVN
ncbi:hypothetical protein MASR2M117_10900 [Paludibacter sp.]